ncbi:MAG TPA: hypothetical protein VHM26_11430, partial [Chitinophagaceae bacterium]|nr:hypothetical protein [Chitinophagaceae bacterium]
MKKFIATATLTFILFSVTAQNIGVGTTTPDASAMLDVNSISKGLLIPRMTSAQRSAIVSPANGLMVFDTNTNSFWYYSGGAWNNFASPSGGGSGWGLTGNGGTNPAANFIGTTDNQPLVIKLNNQRHGLLHPNGNIFLGYIAGEQNTSGTLNTAVGKQSMMINTTGSYNTAFGASALNDNTDGQGNSAFGMGALRNNFSGNKNTAMG